MPQKEEPMEQLIVTFTVKELAALYGLWEELDNIKVEQWSPADWRETLKYLRADLQCLGKPILRAEKEAEQQAEVR